MALSRKLIKNLHFFSKFIASAWFNYGKTAAWPEIFCDFFAYTGKFVQNSKNQYNIDVNYAPVKIPVLNTANLLF